MDLDERLENVAVIGAAGKMGSGIGALIAQEVAKLKIKPNKKDKIFRLYLIDVNEKALDGLRKYIKVIATKGAEKGIVMLREAYKDREDLVENGDIIKEFVDEVMSVLRFSTSIEVAKDANLVFEAIVESQDVKIEVFKKLKDICSQDTFFFTNTSSIPIHIIDEKAELEGRIIGYHFYNPPVVQKLVEVITGKNTRQELKDIAFELGKKLRKKLVPANDIAGFIGNGHFIRDGLFALQEVEKMKDLYSLPGAVYVMNRISQDFLVRPMGIFQLIDYVGIDVFQCILNVMREHLKDESLKSDLIDLFVEKNVLGGQKSDGSQKDGFFKYEKNKPVAVFDPDKGEYVDFQGWKEKLDNTIGNPPEGFVPWKGLLRDPKKDEKLSNYFQNLKQDTQKGSDIAKTYLKQTKAIAESLIAQGVAGSADDVNAVLINGFYWLYGPINNYV